LIFTLSPHLEVSALFCTVFGSLVEYSFVCPFNPSCLFLSHHLQNAL
jgi:hypothetical protein